LAAGCPWTLAHDKEKAIKDIKPGDRVESADSRDGKADGLVRSH
jgi:hypothetical protein